MFDIVEQLMQHASQYCPTIKGDSAWIKCPFHGNGQEHTPSCRINIVKGKYPAGFFYCYGCGKHGNWNALQQAIPELPIIEGETQREQQLSSIRKFTDKEKQSLLGCDCCDVFDFDYSVAWPEDKVWRNISGRLLKAVGARMFYNEKVKDTNLFLPCYQNEELRGGINAVMVKHQGRSAYTNTPGSWVKKTLFLYDYTANRMKLKHNIVAIVEGPRDALNFTQCGFPSVAILGSKNWSQSKAALVQLLNPRLVALALDPDEAGQSAYNTIEKDLKNCCDIVKLQFRGEEDPGNLPAQKIKSLYQKCVDYANTL